MSPTNRPKYDFIYYSASEPKRGDTVRFKEEESGVITHLWICETLGFDEKYKMYKSNVIEMDPDDMWYYHRGYNRG